jgi:RPA family protein
LFQVCRRADDHVLQVLRPSVFTQVERINNLHFQETLKRNQNFQQKRNTRFHRKDKRDNYEKLLAASQVIYQVAQTFVKCFENQPDKLENLIYGFCNWLC